MCCCGRVLICEHDQGGDVPEESQVDTQKEASGMCLNADSCSCLLLPCSLCPPELQQPYLCHPPQGNGGSKLCFFWMGLSKGIPFVRAQVPA